MSKTMKSKIMKTIIGDDLNGFKAISKCLESLNDVINDKSFDNSLHLCSMFNSIQIIHHLLSECVDQIDVNKTNREGKCALHLSSQYKHFVCTQMLLNCRHIAIDCLNRSDWSPLMLALSKDNNLDVVRLLVESKANVKLKNKDGWNGFHIAVRTGCLPQIQYLFACDPSVCDTKSTTNRTPLHTAVLYGHYSVVEFLLDNCGYDCDQRDSCGITPFMESMRNTSNGLAISRLLVEKQNINPFLSDFLGRNALHLSSEVNAIKSVEYLFKSYDFDMNCKTTIGSLTALHLAVKDGHIQTIRLLLELGAKVCLKDSKDRTPVDLAEALNRFDCLKLLQTYG